MASIVLWLPMGLAAGVLNGLTLRWTVNRLRPDASPGTAALVLGGSLLRMGTVVALLAAAFQQGAVAGLLAFAGLWLARWIAICVTLSPPPPIRPVKSLRD